MSDAAGRLHRGGRGLLLCLGMAGAALLMPLSPSLPVAEAQVRYELGAEGWEVRTPPDPQSPEGQLLAARRLLVSEQPREALRAVRRWEKAYPHHPQLVEARLIAGDAQVAMGEHYRSLYDYEFVIRHFPGSDQFRIALEREYEIARLFTSGLKRKFLGMRIFPADGEGEELLIRIQERLPGSELGEKAMLTLADYYYRTGEMANAAEAYDLFLQNYPGSLRREWAMLRQIQASLATFKGPRFDQSGLLDAQERLRLYRQEFPAAADRIGAEALLVRIHESLALRDLTTADWYQRRGKTVSAVALYRRVVTGYPETRAAQEALANLEAEGHRPVE